MTVEVVRDIQGSTLRSLNPNLITILFTITILTLLHFWQQKLRKTQLGNKIPGPKPLPFFGNALEVLRITSRNDVVIEGLKYAEMYGSTVRAWLGPKLLVFLMDPDDVEVVLNSREHIEKSDEYRFFKPWLGDGLLISTGDKWRRHRQLIAPAFHQNVLKTFVDIFNKNSLTVTKSMEKEIGKEFDVHDYMSSVTVDILLETAMGTTKKTNEDNESFDYAMAVMKMCDILHKRHLMFYLRNDLIFNWTKLKKEQEKLLSLIHGLTGKVFKGKKEIFDKNLAIGKLPKPSLNDIINSPKDIYLANKNEGLRDDLDQQDENDIGEKRRLAFLDLMIETGHTTGAISDNEIKEQVDTIMFEGHDTTAAGSSFVLCLLGCHHDIQQKVYEEQQKIFGNSDRAVTFADTVEMKYLERVIYETLRLYPPVPAIARKVNEDVKIATNNYIIPSGTTVVIGTFKVHRCPKYYPNPEVFDPDNFLPERTQGRHYYSYIPFSAGPRSCVGRKYAMLKLKILLSTILRKYKVNSPVGEKDFKLRGDIILKREDGFRIEIEPR